MSILKNGKNLWIFFSFFTSFTFMRLILGAKRFTSFNLFSMSPFFWGSMLPSFPILTISKKTFFPASVDNVCSLNSSRSFTLSPLSFAYTLKVLFFSDSSVNYNGFQIKIWINSTTTMPTTTAQPTTTTTSTSQRPSCKHLRSVWQFNNS